MKTKQYTILVGDFETTVYKGQEFAEVWASAIVPLFSEDVVVLKSISETWNYLKSLKGNILIYYHNLKFDGMFWLSYFLEKLKLQQAFLSFNEEKTEGKWLNEKQMLNNTFKYSISDKGQFYNIIIKQGNRFIEIRDSLKLLPFSVKAIGEGFKTKHKKLDMEYTGFRYSGCEITPEEIEYIKNDVLVVKEALEMMYTQGHTALTIGSCCLEEFKSGYDKQDYTAFFPDIYDIPIEELGISQGDFVRKSYRGA